MPPLILPQTDDVEAVRRSGAGEMFAAYAQMVRPSFAVTPDNAADVAGVCRRLDGLPLALELVAARAKLLSPKALAARLDAVLDIEAASRQTPERHHTMRATIEWSHRLLDPSSQTLFRRLGVFAGGADLEAANAIAGPVGDPGTGFGLLDRLTDLVDASLVVVHEADDGEPRFTLLETVRVYARECLVAHEETDELQAQHAAFYTDLAETLGAGIEGNNFKRDLARFRSEHENLIAALRWGTAPEPGAEGGFDERATLAARLLCAMTEYMYVVGHRAEYREWLERLAALPDLPEHQAIADCLTALGAGMPEDPQRGRAWLKRGMEIATRLGDSAATARATVRSGNLEHRLGNLADARRLFVQALALGRESFDQLAIEDALGGLTHIALQDGDNAAALAHLEEMLGSFRPDAPFRELETHHVSAWVMRRTGHPEEAMKSMRSAVAVLKVIGFAYQNGLNFIADDYAGILAELGHARGAARMMGAVDARRELMAMPRDAVGEADIADSVAKARAALTDAEWDSAFEDGRRIRLEDAVSAAETWSEDV